MPPNDPTRVTLIRTPLRMRLFLPALLLALGQSAVAMADEVMNIDLTIKDHRFSPAEIHVPVGKPTQLTIKNEDATAEEFDSTALKTEKVIAGGRSATVRLRPLGPGRYPFMGEYHADTAQGVVISE
jgi:plastocyanin